MHLENMETTNMNNLFLVWKKYQRRPEVFAPLLDSQLQFIPHLFKSKYLRPLDYLIKLVVSIKQIMTTKPDFVIAQCPPTYSVIPALLTGVPYIIDGHNPLFQVEMWKKIPLTKYLIKNAQAIIVHNSEILPLAESIYPSVRLFNICNPLEVISSSQTQRQDKQILVISSFDPWDEPVDLMIECMEKLNEYTFIVTADINKLPSKVSKRLQQLSNVRLTGFLSVEDYHSVLCTSLAALVLTTSEATQPEGACEALSSDTQLIVSNTSLTKQLFGEWAVLVDNSLESIIKAVRSLSPLKLDLSSYRDQWNSSVQKEIDQLRQFMDECKNKQ